jgi:hypothetical protein
MMRGRRDIAKRRSNLLGQSTDTQTMESNLSREMPDTAAAMDFFSRVRARQRNNDAAIRILSASFPP